MDSDPEECLGGQGPLMDAEGLEKSISLCQVLAEKLEPGG